MVINIFKFKEIKGKKFSNICFEKFAFHGLDMELEPEPEP